MSANPYEGKDELSGTLIRVVPEANEVRFLTLNGKELHVIPAGAVVEAVRIIRRNIDPKAEG